jgi:uncharacterized membrane protein YGL010W
MILFVIAWIGQFIGHAIEGKRPSFFKDVQFLMIGPLWLIADVYGGWAFAATASQLTASVHDAKRLKFLRRSLM